MSDTPLSPVPIDAHMHTPLCGHASGHPLQYVEQAAKVGLQRITFTCHIPMRFAGFGQDGIRMRRDQLPLYRQIVAQARDHGESLGVEVLCGIEAEIHPHQPFMEEMDAILQTEPFDFVLGSLHHMLPAFRDWLDEQGHHSDETIIEAYFNCIGQAALSGRYHSLAHPDVIRVYNTLKGSFLPENHEEAIHRFLERVREAGICLEINTSGRIKGDYIAHPDPLIADWALGMEIPFTIGSDSHTPERVGDGFAETLNTLQSLGLREVLGFKQGKPTAFKLDGPVGLAIADA